MQRGLERMQRGRYRMQRGRYRMQRGRYRMQRGLYRTHQGLYRMQSRPLQDAPRPLSDAIEAFTGRTKAFTGRNEAFIGCNEASAGCNEVHAGCSERCASRNQREGWMQQTARAAARWPVRSGARGEVRRRCRGGFNAQPAEDSRRVHVSRCRRRAHGRMRSRARVAAADAHPPPHGRHGSLRIRRRMGATCRCDVSCCVAIDLPHGAVSAGGCRHDYFVQQYGLNAVAATHEVRTTSPGADVAACGAGRRSCNAQHTHVQHTNVQPATCNMQLPM
jgi:hypothetical protein